MPPARSRTLAIALGLALLAGLAAAAWTLARQEWWTTPTRQAERALDAGDLLKAGMILTRVIQDDPRDARARLLYARLLRLSGRTHDADVALAKAQDLGTPEADLFREYGLLLAGPDFAKAEAFLVRALDGHPDDVEALRALADGLSRQGRWDQAADYYSRWLRAEPDRPEALQGRSRALVQAHRSREAEADLRAILGRRPDDYDARLLLANCFLNDARTEEAAPELERCVKIRPDRPEPLVGLALCLIERGDPDRARALLDRAVALDPSSLLALAARGNLAMKARRHDQALADFEKVIELDPKNKTAHLHLAQLYRRAGDPSRAAEHERAFRALDDEQGEKFRAVRGLR